MGLFDFLRRKLERSVIYSGGTGDSTKGNTESETYFRAGFIL